MNIEIDISCSVMCMFGVSTQSEYVRSDIEDTKKSLKDTVVPAVSRSTSVWCVRIMCMCVCG